MEEQVQVQDDKDEVTAEQIAMEQALNPEEDKFDEDEQDVNFGLEDIRLAQNEQE